MFLLQLEYANCDTLMSQSWCGVFFMFFLTFASSGSFAGGPCCSLLWLWRLSSHWVCWAEVWWVQYFRSSPPGLEQTPSTPVRPLCEQLCPGLTHPATTWPSNSSTQYLQAELSSFPALRSTFIWALCWVTRWPTRLSVTQWMYSLLSGMMWMQLWPQQCGNALDWLATDRQGGHIGLQTLSCCDSFKFSPGL